MRRAGRIPLRRADRSSCWRRSSARSRCRSVWSSGAPTRAPRARHLRGHERQRARRARHRLPGALRAPTTGVRSRSAWPRPGCRVRGRAELFEADVAAVELVRRSWPADTGPARRLRGAGGPGATGARFELEIDRVVRTASRRWHLPGRFAFLYDRVTVRSGGLVREFQELKVRRLARGRPRLEEVALALEQGAGLRPVLPTKLVRARTLLRQMGQREHHPEPRLRPRGRGDRAGGRRASRCCGDGEDRRLPVTAGAGEQAVRHGLGEWFGSRVADVSAARPHPAEHRAAAARGLAGAQAPRRGLGARSERSERRAGSRSRRSAQRGARGSTLQDPGHAGGLRGGARSRSCPSGPRPARAKAARRRRRRTVKPIRRPARSGGEPGRVQRAGARGGGGRADAAARAPALPRDRERQSGRALHELRPRSAERERTEESWGASSAVSQSAWRSLAEHGYRIRRAGPSLDPAEREGAAGAVPPRILPRAHPARDHA